MADLFISYSRKDLSRVRVLADALSTQGWSVWWDRQIPAGRTFDEVLAEALDGARCVVVVWSKESIDSSWVREEAEEGRRRKILIPVLIDDQHPPLGFGRIQAVELRDWNGDQTSDAFQTLVTGIASILGPPPAPGTPKQNAPAIRASVVGATKLIPNRKIIGGSLAAALLITLFALGVHRLGTAAGSSQPQSRTEPSAEPILRLNAVMADGGEPLTGGVSYEVSQAVKNVEGNRKPVVGSQAYEGPPTFHVPAGRYYVTATYGNASASTEVEVAAARLTMQTLNLRAGNLKLSSVLARDDPALASGVSYEIYEAAKDLEGNRKSVAGSPAYEGPPTFHVPAGRYYVTATYGSASTSTEVVVTAAKLTIQTLPLNAGILKLSSVLATGSPPFANGVSYEVYEAAKDTDGNRKPVAGSPAYEGPPTFPVPAGRYYVTAASNAASGEAEVAVSAGAVQQLQLRLNRAEQR